MRRTEQTKLSEFSELKDETALSSNEYSETNPVASSLPVASRSSARPKNQLWFKVVNLNQEWGVCNFDGTVLLIRLVNGRIYAHGEEAVCKWCGDVLEIRDDKIFCSGRCRRYQGEFSKDLNDYLRWEGAKSYTLRKIVAGIEGLELEASDLEPIDYAPDWSVLYEYADETSEEANYQIDSKE
ncbi:MAG: hypothetical protein JW779_15490 [Candidatus Thorarchaeota archaeon]|nr:hypothetical protein [Candidatus Thorarchaeota archaeon]